MSAGGLDLTLRRLVAAMIDGVALAVLTVVLALALSVLLGVGGASEATLAQSGRVVAVVVYVLYFATLERGAGTVGKAAMKIEVRTAGGTGLTYAAAITRQIAKAALFWTTPLALFGWVPLHDRLTATRVVRRAAT